MEKTQYRIDHSPFRKCHKTDDGYLYAEATFARDGILEYTNADGSKRRELRLPEENKKALTGFGRKPFTVEHPPLLVSSTNSKQLSVGMTDPEVVYDKSGFVRGVITVMDSDAVDMITSGKKPEVSVGYQCRLENTPGVWQGERYDAIQRDIVVNHVCCTAKGRAGKSVRIHLDSDTAESFDLAYSADSLDVENTPYKGGIAMADLTIGKATFKDLPSDVVAAMSSELQRVDSITEELNQVRSDNKDLQSSLSESNQRADSLEAELTEVKDRADTQEGRADRYEEILEDSISILNEEGYKWDSDDSSFVREDMGSKKLDMGKKNLDMKMGMEEEDEDDEDMPMEYKGKKKDGYKKGDGSGYKKDMGKKKDGGFKKFDMEEKKDSVEDIVSAVLEAETLCPGIRQDSDLASLSVREIQEQVIGRFDSDIDLSEVSDGFVAGLYYSYSQSARQDSADEDTRTDSADYTSPAAEAFNATTVAEARDTRNDALESYAGASGVRMAEAWRQSL